MYESKNKIRTNGIKIVNDLSICSHGHSHRVFCGRLMADDGDDDDDEDDKYLNRQNA